MRPGRAWLLGAMTGVAAVAVAEAARPRGPSTTLIDWSEVRAAALRHLGRAQPFSGDLARLSGQHQRLAIELTDPILEFAGPQSTRIALPPVQAIDRSHWLDVNLTALQLALDPVLESGRLRDSVALRIGRAGVDRWLGHTLGFLGGRVLGQYDPHLLGGPEAVSPGLYLIEPNVLDWERAAGLPATDLRRWLILHELTHAWQFAAHPWLKEHLEGLLQTVLAAVSSGNTPVARLAAWAGRLPVQLRAAAEIQAVMSVVEGYCELVTSVLGRRLLRGFDALENAHRRRRLQVGAIELVMWRLSGLDLKRQQYRRGEAFCREVFERYGRDTLNRVWSGPDAMPRPDELRSPERWYGRLTRRKRIAARAARYPRSISS